MKEAAVSPSSGQGQGSGKSAKPAAKATPAKPAAQARAAAKNEPKSSLAKKTAPNKAEPGKVAASKAVTAKIAASKTIAKPTPAPAPTSQPRKTDSKVKTITAAPMKPQPAPAKTVTAAKLPAKLATPMPEAAKPAAAAKPVAKPAVVKAVAARPAAPAAVAPVVPAPVAVRPVVAPRAMPASTQEIRKPIIPERPVRVPSKQETFVEGDHVVYPTHGVGMVERIVVEDIAGHRLELIHITFEENRMTLRVPVTKARTAGLRKLASRKMFDEAMAVLKGRARIKRTMWSRRAQEYEAKINSGDPLAIAEVVRDLHRNAGQPDQSFSERQIYEAAMDRLAAELAALDKTDKVTAAIKLVEFLKTI